MKALFVGGTGTISAAISRRVLDLGWELWLLNRGNRAPETWNADAGASEDIPARLHHIRCDIADEAEAAGQLAGLDFDVAADFIAYTPDQAERDYRLFKGRTAQYIFISSASAYQKPLSSHVVTEGTPLANPCWEYSRGKIACEEALMKRYREDGFPLTIVRPSHTYDDRKVPLGVHGKKGSWQVIKRIIEGKPVIIHGDGTSLWTMTHHSDFARAFTGLMGNSRALGEAVQITSGETLCWNQIYQAIADALGKPLKAVHVSSEFLALAAPDYDFAGGLTGDKAVSVVFDNAKLKRLVPEFCASVRFDQGIRDTIGHILAHPELQEPDPDFDRFCDRVIAAREKALAELAG
ncbi:MAG: NAD-dependent epimerase/dehydratase family protein [Spirochaetaceae bacterium]|jgi:nucleoside-diphosphate-sugar epimerase|nr:NAD-dependent epimerase/dehydratase family protein [Spirochaetaceae bacterium]